VLSVRVSLALALLGTTCLACGKNGSVNDGSGAQGTDAHARLRDAKKLVTLFVVPDTHRLVAKEALDALDSKGIVAVLMSEGFTIECLVPDTQEEEARVVLRDTPSLRKYLAKFAAK